MFNRFHSSRPTCPTCPTRRGFVSLGLFAALALSAFGCDAGDSAAGGNAASDGFQTVGFSQAGEESSWRAAETRSIRGEAEKRGVNLKFSDAQGKQENQIKALRAFIAQGVDAIILAPIVETGWEQPLKEAQRAGIPVILVDRGVAASEDLYETLIASDFVEEGRMAANFVVEKTGGSGNIVELEGTPGSAPANDRKAGFAEIINQHDGLTISRSQSGDFSKSRGKEVMEAFLKSDRNIDVVYAHNDDMALGAIQAIEEAGLKPGEDILIVSIDGVKAAFDAMKAGKLNASVECNPLLGPAAFDALEQLAAGETLPKKTVVEDKIYVAEDVTDEIIASRQY